MLGALIRRERERRGLSQVRLARLVGCTPKTIWRLEHDPGLRPHVRIKRRLAAALDLPLETVEEAIRRQLHADTERPPGHPAADLHGSPAPAGGVAPSPPGPGAAPAPISSLSRRAPSDAAGGRGRARP